MKRPDVQDVPMELGGGKMVEEGSICQDNTAGIYFG
jgi:hypothetical protein